MNQLHSAHCRRRRKETLNSKKEHHEANELFGVHPLGCSDRSICQYFWRLQILSAAYPGVGDDTVRLGSKPGQVRGAVRVSVQLRLIASGASPTHFPPSSNLGVAASDALAQPDPRDAPRSLWPRRRCNGISRGDPGRGDSLCVRSWRGGKGGRPEKNELTRLWGSPSLLSPSTL